MAESGAKVGALSLPLRETLFHAIAADLNGSSTQSLSSSLLHHLQVLSKMNASWQLLPSELQTAIVSKVKANCSLFSPDEAVCVLQSVSTMKVPIGALSYPALEGLLEIMDDNFSRSLASSINLSYCYHMLHILGEIGVQWSMCSPGLQQHLAAFITQIMQDCSSVEVLANALNTLGQLKLTVQKQLELSELVLTAVHRCLPNCSSGKNLVDLIEGLSKFGCKWKYFSSDLQADLPSTIARSNGQFSLDNIVALVSGLKSIHAPSGSFSPSALDAIFCALHRHFDTMESREVSSVLLSLSQTEVSWNMLPDTIKRDIVDSLRRRNAKLDMSQISSCAYALALMCFDAADPVEPSLIAVYEAMFDAIAARESVIQSLVRSNNAVLSPGFQSSSSSAQHIPIEVHQLSVFAHYLNSTAKDIISCAELPSVLLSNDVVRREINKKSSHVKELESKLIDKLSAAIGLHPEASDYKVIANYSSFSGVLPVNAAVLMKGEVVTLLEIGSSHLYRFGNKKLRSLKLKEHMYKSRHPEANYCWANQSKVESMLSTPQLM